jgi:hypothetical protein
MWKLTDRYKLTALDFGMNLNPNPAAIKSRKFRKIQQRLIKNDFTEHSLLWILEARIIFNSELQNMPETYITRFCFLLMATFAERSALCRFWREILPKLHSAPSHPLCRPAASFGT